MKIGPELLDIEDMFTKIVIRPLETYIVCKKPHEVREELENYEVGRSQDYIILTEDEAIRRGI